MKDEIHINGENYLASRQAAEIVGYTQDYVGQLARKKIIDAHRNDGLWYVNVNSLKEHKMKSKARAVKQPLLQHRNKGKDSVVMLDGNKYISSKKASKITGYTQDYIGQLARGKVIPARRIGSRWFVIQEALEAHKGEKDALLAEVQKEATGLKIQIPSSVGDLKTNIQREPEVALKYYNDEGDLFPTLKQRLHDNNDGTTESAYINKSPYNKNDVENRLAQANSSTSVNRGAIACTSAPEILDQKYIIKAIFVAFGVILTFSVIIFAYVTINRTESYYRVGTNHKSIVTGSTHYGILKVFFHTRFIPVSNLLGAIKYKRIPNK